MASNETPYERTIMTDNEKLAALVAAGVTAGVVIGSAAVVGVRKLISDRATELLKDAAIAEDAAKKAANRVK